MVEKAYFDWMEPTRFKRSQIETFENLARLRREYAAKLRKTGSEYGDDSCEEQAVKAEAEADHYEEVVGKLKSEFESTANN